MSQSLNKRRPMSAAVTRRNTEKAQMGVYGEFDTLSHHTNTTQNKKRNMSTRNMIQLLETTKFEKLNTQHFDNQQSRNIWRAFGSYIAKHMINGKAIQVPRFGQFTFSAPEVKLAGTTNPQQRDKQNRDLVFVVGKDFCSGVMRKSTDYYTDTRLKAGKCAGDALRPNEVKGINGVVPEMKINYFEVGQYCGESKETCREHCEMLFKNLSDRVRRGEQVSQELPFVGRFLVRNRVVAFQFINDLVMRARGTCPKQNTVGQLFGSQDATNNLHMLKQDEVKKRLSLKGGAQSLEATEWLYANNGIDVEHMPRSPNKMRTIQREDSVNERNFPLSAERLSRLDGFTPQRGPASRVYSNNGSRATTAMASHMSQLPVADQHELNQIAQTVFSNTQAIVDTVSSATNVNLRDILPTSKIHQLMKVAGLDLTIIQLKQLLRELGFAFNGASTSVMSLLQACRSMVQAQKTAGTTIKDPDAMSDMSALTGMQAPKVVLPPDMSKPLQAIKDLFYHSKKSLFDLFRMVVNFDGKHVDKQGFLELCAQLSNNNFNVEETGQVFMSNAKGGKMTFEIFHKTFNPEIPNTLEMETKVIRTVREWMFKNNLSAEKAFDAFCKANGRFQEKKLTQAMFKRAMTSLEVGLSAPQIDSLFTLLVSEANGELDMNMWMSRVYEDGDNPLQMIREVVMAHNLTQDDLMHQMHLKLWSDPLTQTELKNAIRKLDDSISDSQIRALYLCLKNGKGLVAVPSLIQNLTGKSFETVDFRDQIYNKLYKEIFPAKEAKLIEQFQEADKENNAMVKAKEVYTILKKNITSISQNDIERFCRFLETDAKGRISYTDFMSKCCENQKQHNPFRALVNRLAYFIRNNQITVGNLLKKIAGGETHVGIPIHQFAQFLKQKVDKKSEIEQLKRLTQMIDVDRDQLVSEIDIATCLKNLPNQIFWEAGHGGRRLTLNDKKATDVTGQIHDAMKKKKIPFKALFEKMDVNEDNFISLAEFQQGLSELLTLSRPVVEQLFNLMDKNKIQMVNFDQFCEVLQKQKYETPNVNGRDNFDWEMSMVQEIKKWIVNENLHPEEAFKRFDKDFDGFVSKEDLKLALQNNLRVPSYQINDTRLNRLFQMLDTFKSGQIQPSDFTKLTKNDRSSTSNSWKRSVIQQAGLLMSKKFANTAESFQACAGESEKVNFEQLSKFLTQNHFLLGFSMTPQLLQELFSYLDPHKKGFLNLNDWKQSFGGFNQNDQQLLELKTLIAATFANYDSAFKFLLSFNDQAPFITQTTFKKAITQLSNERFSQEEVAQMWSQLCQNGVGRLDKYLFRKHFANLNYTGVQLLATTKRPQSARPGQSTIKSTVASAKWENNIIEKMKSLLKCASRPMTEIFKQFNPDGDNYITQNEFRNAVRQLNLGLTSREIDQLMVRIDDNKDGMIDFNEFCMKFAVGNQDQAMQLRTKDKLAQLKELIIKHMTSTADAFRYFDEDKEQALNFAQFNRLVTKCYEMAHFKVPAYPVVKDLFDQIDVRKDGKIDNKEWISTFGAVTDGNAQLSMKATEATAWENSRDFDLIGIQIAKNRKLLHDTFKQYLEKKGVEGTHFTFEQGREALDNWLYANFKGSVSNSQLKCVFGVALDLAHSQKEPRYDFCKLLEVYKARHSGPQK